MALMILPAGCRAAPTATAAAVADDFAIQGEYLGGYVGDGSPADTALGVQVVAHGNGSFTAVFLKGGLPGAGWDGSGRAAVDGTLGKDTAVFSGPVPGGIGMFTARIAADGNSIAGLTPQGVPFTLPKVVRTSTTLGAPPPAQARVLFDGTDLSAFAAGSAVLDSGLLRPQGSAGTGAVTTAAFGDFTLHLEFRVPFMPDHTGQARGNSGVYLQGRYELQILDSFGLDLAAEGAAGASQECGAFYQLAAPDLGMSLPPLSWQTYDVDFRQARFDSAGKVQTAPATATVRLNGVAVHTDRALASNTLLGDPPGPGPGPLRFQAHGDPVAFRNIWIEEKSGTPIRPAPPARKSRRTGAVVSDPEADVVRADGRRLPELPVGTWGFPHP